MDFLLGLVRGAIGISVLIGICYLLSSNRKHIDWPLVLKGIGIQVTLAVLILYVPFIETIFDVISRFFVIVLDFTEAGAQFLFGDLITNIGTFGYIFVFQVLPTIVFFAALSSVLYYLGVLQRIIYGFAWLMKRIMGLSGAESLAAAANVFIGQTEAPLIVKPYLERMTKSEILCLMTGGMATIAGGVFAAYVGYLGDSFAVIPEVSVQALESSKEAIEAAKQIFAQHLVDLTNLRVEDAAAIADELIAANPQEISSEALAAAEAAKEAARNLLLNIY